MSNGRARVEYEIPRPVLWERVDAAETRLIAAIRLHIPQMPDNDRCPTCNVEWPCDTARILGGVTPGLIGQIDSKGKK